jgi:CheY-like chemotaxis protein/DNA-binding transcriptional ArsR family regulator
MATIEDTLDSLGHSFDRAHSQREAIKFATANQYAYILIDIEMPANRKGARPERVHGYHLLETLNSKNVCESTPIIIMDGDAHCLDYVFDYIRKGAVRFAGKAPTDSRRLARAVRETLKEWTRRTRHSSSSGRPAAFCDGELVIYPDRAELLGVRIISNSGPACGLRLLRALADRNKRRCPSMAATDLMSETGIDSQNTVTGSIRTLRDNCIHRLQRELGVQCGKQDIIAHSEQGYRFASWIEVRVAGEDVPDVTADTNDDAADALGALDIVTERPLNDRQQWALAEIERGVPFQRTMLEARFDVSDRTAKRDLLELRQAGLIAWVRDGSTGFYRLAESVETAA